MKRNAIYHNLKLKKVYIYFIWTDCKICGKEFRKEVMWRWGDWDNRSFACKECCPSLESIENYFIERGRIDKADRTC